MAKQLLGATRPQSRDDGRRRLLSNIRNAVLADLDALLEIETASFDGDRLSRRSYRALILRDSAKVLIADDGDGAAASAVLLFNRATSVARIYSIAVHPRVRGRGLARAILRAAEKAALARDCALLRLETRADNLAAQTLFAKEGFAQVGHVPAYYEVGADALKLERCLWGVSTRAASGLISAPYYAQTLDFTCGPAALMMAMGALDPSLRLDRGLELRNWREATTVFMTSGHGGCGPFGLALAAHRRGFAATVHAPAGSAMFLDGVRDPEKKRVIDLVERDFLDDLASTTVAISRSAVSTEVLAAHLKQGAIPVLLVSLYRLHGEKGPHWITVIGYDGHVFRVLDPMSPPASGASPELSIGRRELERMSRYGRSRQAAAVIVSKP